MATSIFREKNTVPTDGTLSDALGKNYSYYLDLSDIAKKFKFTWNFSKSSGWILKMADPKKALLYLTPLEDAFQIGLTLRENEREIFLLNTNMEFVHSEIETAKRYSEGFLMQFLVSDKTSFLNFKVFITELIKLR